jgi:hypothetical protein
MQLPLPYVAGELAANRLVTVLDQYAPPPSEGFFLYYPSRRQTRDALKMLVDSCATRAAAPWSNARPPRARRRRCGRSRCDAPAGPPASVGSF